MQVSLLLLMLLFTTQAIVQRNGAPVLINSTTGYGVNLIRFPNFQVCVLIFFSQMLLHTASTYVWVWVFSIHIKKKNLKMIINPRPEYLEDSSKQTNSCQQYCFFFIFFQIQRIFLNLYVGHQFSIGYFIFNFLHSIF